MKIILFGPPGSGKGTQTQRLIQAYKLPKIVTGDILRAKAKTDPQLQALLGSGDLVPDEMICEMVCERLSKPDCRRGYILDGFPRTVKQAEYLREYGVEVDIMFVLKVSDRELLKRLGGRQIHEASGRVYNIHSCPPKEPGKDDETGEPLITRKDDTEKAIKHRLEVYHRATEPVVNFYQTSSIPVVIVDGEQTPGKLFSEIQALLEKN